MKPIEDIFPLLHQAKRIVIVPHQKPDADAMGASLALSHFLRQFGHSVTIISPTNWASWLNWMPGCNEVIDYDMFKEKAEKILDQAEWVFCLDFNAIYRTKNLTAKLEQVTCPRILIDHHQQPGRRLRVLVRDVSRPRLHAALSQGSVSRARRRLSADV